jgi:hypothetical protein
MSVWQAVVDLHKFTMSIEIINFMAWYGMAWQQPNPSHDRFLAPPLLVLLIDNVVGTP